ncbi:MAG: RHS repeat-associated core domain-containing protein, partial [Candidatus Methylomirabilales bacterium]
IADTFNHLIRLVQVGPEITGLNPTSGVQGDTLTLTVTGTNLTGASALSFLQNGVADANLTASNLTVNAAGTQLTATVAIAPTAALGNRVVTVTTPSGTSTSTPSAANTFTVQGKLALTPSPLTVTEGATALLTVSIFNPAPAGGLPVALTSAGPTIATVASPVTIIEGSTSTTAPVTGVSTGGTNLTASALGFADATVGVVVTLPVPTITDFTPGSGRVGDTVTITGTGFRPTAADNIVSFTGPNNTRVTTPVTTATRTQLTVTVPDGAITGPLQVVTAGGTATSTGSFIVLPTEDFTLSALPNTLSVPATGQGAFTISLGGTVGFTNLTTLAVNGVPVGTTATFGAPTLTAGQSALLTVRTAGTTAQGSFPLTVSATGLLNGVQTTRSATVTLAVQAAGVTSLTGQVLDEEAKPVQGAVVTLGALQATTDEGGNFLLLNPPVGPDQLLFIDGGPASTPARNYPIIPYKVTIVAGQANTLGFTPHLHFQKTTGLVDISNSAVERVVTDPDLPGFEMRIPAGVTITGWDGQPNTRISIRRVAIDRHPLPPFPEGYYSPVGYMYYFGKPGGGTPSEPIPITAPNDLGLPPGTQVELWFYDEAPDGTRPNQWAQYGTGTISADGSQIIPDTDPTTGKPFGQPRFCCGYFRSATTAELLAQINPLRGGIAEAAEPTQGGEPVNLSTGTFVLEKTDLILSGRIPVAFTRTYRTNGAPAGPFGPGTSHPYHILLLIEQNLRTLLLPAGARLAFPRQPDGTFRNFTDPSMRGAVLTQSASAHTLRFKDGTAWSFGDAPLRIAFLIAQTDRNGNTVTLTRSGALQNVTTITEPSGRQLLVTNDANNRITAITDPIGRTVTYSYDANGRLASVTDPAGGVTTYTYDAAGRMLTITDPLGITFLTNEYDANGRVIRQTQADGGVWTFAYTTTAGVITQTVVTDPRGHPITSRFSGQGYLLSTTDALGQTTTFTRDPATNLLLSTTDPLGRVTRFAYDANGNVTSITDPAGNVRTFTYDPTFNRLTSITDPLGNVTTFEYDAQGNLIAITDPLQNTKPEAERLKTQIAYNAFGQPLSTTDPLGNITTFAYNAQGDLASIADPLANTTTRTYDLVSRLIAQTDPRGKTTRFAYDALNRITQLVDALNGVTAFSYDGNGNLLSVTDARGSVTTHTYDVMDRLATRTDPLNRLESFTYDPNGNLTQFTDRKNQVSTFTYDPLNRRTRSNFADATFTEFTYDAAGRLLQVSDSQTGAILEEYDLLDRLIRESTAQGSITYGYDALGRRTTMTVDGQPPVGYSYNANSRLTQIVQGTQTVTITYNALNRRTLLTLPNGVSTEYQYDPASRLTALIYRNAAGILGNLSYTYDPAGNRIAVGGSFARTILPDPLLSATYDAANQQLVFGDRNMTYDPNGNLSTINDPTETTTFVWDARNRLITVSSPNLTGSFAYDVQGRRIRRVIATEVREYQYDGRDVARELVNGEEIGYVRTLAVDEPLSRVQPGETSYYLADALSSTVALTDGTGVIATTYSYEPFGRTIIGGRLSTNAFQFAGRENDSGGLYFNRARYYSPKFARFLSEDPIRLGGGLNFYAYALGNPVLSKDPLGLAPCQSIGADNCRMRLRECRVKAIKDEVQCSLIVGALTVACFEGVAAACLLTGPAGFGPCFAALSAGCAAVGEVGLYVCKAIFAIELVNCQRDFRRCLKKGGSRDP